MPNTLRQMLVIAMLIGGAGCKSGPRWDWWRLGRSGAPDSSPIARSAGPALPSELAQQDGASATNGDFQMPSVDSGGEVPAYEKPDYSASGAGLAAGRPTGGTGYPSTGAPPATGPAGNYPTTAAGDPFARASTRGASAESGPSVQTGLYDPNAVAAASPAQATTPAATQGENRYGGGGMETGGSNLASADRSPYHASPWPDAGSASPQGVAAAGYQQDDGTPTSGGMTGGSFPPVSPGSAGGGAPATNNLANNQNNLGSAYGNNGGRYGTEGGAASVTQSAPMREGTGGPISYASPYGGGSSEASSELAQGTPHSEYSSSVAQRSTGASSAQPYRPGGTSDYAGPNGSSPVSLAGRPSDMYAPPAQSTEDATEDPADATATGGPYSTPPSSYGTGGSGRRY